MQEDSETPSRAGFPQCIGFGVVEKLYLAFLRETNSISKCIMAVMESLASNWR